MKNNRLVSLVLALVLVLSMTASAFALPDSYVHHCPRVYDPETGKFTTEGALARPDSPLNNNSDAYIFAKFVPESCSIWVYGQLWLADEDDVIGLMKGLAVFQYTEDARVIEMVAYQDVYGFARRGANLQITEPGRYFAAVVDKAGYYATFPKDFIITQEMIDAASGSIEN